MIFVRLCCSLKLECEKLAQEKTEIQRQYIMVSWHRLHVSSTHIYYIYIAYMHARTTVYKCAVYVSVRTYESSKLGGIPVQHSVVPDSTLTAAVQKLSVRLLHTQVQRYARVTCIACTHAVHMCCRRYSPNYCRDDDDTNSLPNVFQYYEMSYGLNVEMHKQVMA